MFVGRKRRKVRAEATHARVAEAAAVLERRDRDLRLVEVHALDAGVDLDPHDRLEVLAPDRVVAIHHVVPVLRAGDLDPERVARLAVDVALRALLEDVGDLLAVRVAYAV